MTTPYGGEQFPEDSGERAAHDSVFRVNARPAPLDEENYPEFFKFSAEASAETRYIPRYSDATPSESNWVPGLQSTNQRPDQDSERQEAQRPEPERWEIPTPIPHMRSRPSAAERAGETLPARRSRAQASSEQQQQLTPPPKAPTRAAQNRAAQNHAKPTVTTQGQGRRRAKRTIASYLWPFQAFTAARPTSTRIRSRSTSATVWQRFKRDRLAVVSGVTIVVLVVLAIAAPLISSVLGVDPTTPHYDLIDPTFGPHSGFGGMSAAHPLGVDYTFGRDLLSRLLYGARISLLIAVAATILTVGIGTVLGAVAGYKGGRTDLVITRFMDLFLAFPLVVFALGLAGALGPHAFGLQGNSLHIALIVFVIGFFNWPYMARMVRGEVLSLREREFIEAARGLGADGKWIIVRELMPNLMSPIIVYGTLLIPTNIVFEATLSYLGVGIDPPAASWGQLLHDASGHVSADPAYLIVPGMAVFITVLAFNLFGDGLRDALDPTA